MADKEAEDTEKPAKSGGGLMSVLPVAVIAAAGTFGMVWFAATPQPVEVLPCEVIEEEPIDPEELAARAASYVSLEPIVVTLGPEAGADHLRITIALGRPAEAAELTEVQFLRLRDRFLERLRLTDLSLITDPAAMPELKASLLEQAHSTLGDDAVYSVLVTDFLLK
ncbi:MAG: flagellar basal body-associated FliL family protein [Pseudomonadota bacterium]